MVRTVAAAVYPMMQALAASCAAQRVNQGYVKYNMDIASFSDADGTVVNKVTNRELTVKFLNNPDTITDEDRELAAKIRSYYQALTFKILGDDYLSKFDRSVMELLEKEECVGNYNLAVLSSVPGSYLRSKQRDDADRRAKFADGGYLGKLGERVEVKCMVLKSTFSQKYNIHFITAITENDQALFFSYANEILYGSFINIKGTVKRQDNNITQLNRVKILNEKD